MSLRRDSDEGQGFGSAPIRVEGLGMKKRRGRLQYSEASAEERARREDIRAVRDAFYAQRRAKSQPLSLLRLSLPSLSQQAS